MKRYFVVFSIIIGIGLLYYSAYYAINGYFPPKNDIKLAKQITGLPIDVQDVKISLLEKWNPNGEGETFLKYKINNISKFLPLDKKFKMLPIHEDVTIISECYLELSTYLSCNRRLNIKNLNCTTTFPEISNGFYYLEKDPNSTSNYYLIILDFKNNLVLANISYSNF